MDANVRAPLRSLVETEDRVDPSEPGAAWWRYKRPTVVGSRAPEPVPDADELEDLEDTEGTLGAGPPGHAPAPEPIRGAATYGSYAAVAIPCLIGATLISTRVFGFEHLGVVAFPLAGLIGATAYGNRCRRLRPDEPWLPRLILLGTIVKLAAVLIRYVTFDVLYNRVGDAYVYDREGREAVAYWLGDRAGDPLEGLRLTGSNFIRFLTAVVYLLFGRNLLAGFLLFGLLALIGSYFWYRAFADAVTIADKRLFLILMLFMPSVIFWPGSLGKEALMQLCLGALAWATSLILQGRVVQALPLIAGGGALTYVLRPHLLALATVAAVVPIFIGRMRGESQRPITTRPAVMVLAVIAVMFTMSAGMKFVGIESFSLDSVEEQLDEQTRQTSYGGSAFEHPGFSVTNPLFLPFGFVTVVFRPFLWESTGWLPLLASLESAVLVAFVVARRASIRTAFRYARREPFLLYCIALIVLYSATLSSLANFGLISRQRSLVLPAVYALICVMPQLRPRGTPSREAEDEPTFAPLVLSQAVERTLGNGDGNPGNGHGNGSGNGHGRGNGHGNGHGNGDWNGGGNGHGNGGGNGRGNGHKRGNGNGPENGNSRSREHWNGGRAPRGGPPRGQ